MLSTLIDTHPDGHALSVTWPALGLQLVVGRDAAFWMWGGWVQPCVIFLA